MVATAVVTHSIRHSIATHLLETGSPTRQVQALMGHESIESTLRYTHMVHENLKNVYKSYQPRENLCFKEIDDEYRHRFHTLLTQLQDASAWNRRHHLAKKAEQEMMARGRENRIQ